MNARAFVVILAGIISPWFDGNPDIIETILTGVWVVMAIYVFHEVRKTYERGGTFTNRLLALWFLMWGVYHSALILSSLYGVWLLPLDENTALIGGLFLIAGGAGVLAAGMIEFGTWRRSCGQDITKLVTTGIYRWSRNPQFIGCLLYLAGISLAGRSGFAFALTAAASLVIYRYTVRLAEPYLECLYGEEYRLYKSKVSRWVGRRRSA